MRNILVLILTLALFACDNDTIIHAPDEHTETVMIVVNADREIFLSTGGSPVTLEELPREVNVLLNSENEYSFVIQAAESGGAYAKEIEEILYSQGVKSRHVAIANASP